MDAFIQWAAEKGVVAKGLEIKEAGPGLGFGVFSTRVHPPESVFIRLPYSLIINAGAVASKPRYRKLLEDNGDRLKPFELLTLFFCLEDPFKSEYGPYFQILPKSFDTPIAKGIKFDPLEIPSTARGFFESQLRELDMVWRKIGIFCEKASLPLNYEKFIWAWHVVNTRCIYLENAAHPLVDNSDGDTIAVIPYVDMLNHSPHAQGFAFYDKVKREYCVRAARTVSEDHQVFVCYGPHDNIRLCIEYGFTLDDNPNGKVAIPQDLLIALARKVGVMVTSAHLAVLNEAAQPSTIYASDEGPSWSLRTNIQILLLTKEELRRWKEIVYADENPRRKLREDDEEQEDQEHHGLERIKIERDLLKKMLEELVVSIQNRAQNVNSHIKWAWDEQAKIVTDVINSLS